MSAYQGAVAELEALGVMPVGRPKLEPMRQALEKTGLLRAIDPARNIIVAGTNGKGSTAATLSALLTDTGARVGLYTSPHLVTTRERIRVGENDISEECFADAYQDLRTLIAEERLTHFEALTLIAAHVFYSGKRPVDWAVWEVGLGGRFDATNVIPHHPCVITRLGLDHQEYLGSTLAEIAREKFGVIRPGSTVVYSPMEPELAALRDDASRDTSCLWVPSWSWEHWGKPALALAGQRARENTAAALTLFERLGFEPDRHLAALQRVRWPGRFSAIDLPGVPCPVFVSGDHNPQGIRSLLEILEDNSWQTLHLVLGVAKDKDAAEMLRLLATLPRTRIYLTETAFKPLPLSEYPVISGAEPVYTNPDVIKIIEYIGPRVAPRDLVVVTGSLYLVGPLLERLHTCFQMDANIFARDALRARTARIMPPADEHAHASLRSP